MNTIRDPRPRVELRADDPSLTSRAGLLLVRETVRALGAIETIDQAVGAIKARRRGLSAGQYLVGLAESLLAGAECLSDLDPQRHGREVALRSVNPPPSTTAGSLARRFSKQHREGLQASMAGLVGRFFNLLEPSRRKELGSQRPTIDLDPTDIEVYGGKKQGVAWNYRGERCGRAVVATWAEAGLVVAGELVSGNTDPRPLAPELIAGAVAALPKGLSRSVVRADSGLCSVGVAKGALAAGADFAIAAKRRFSYWEAVQALPDDAWREIPDLDGAEVADLNYAPQKWPQGTRVIARRVRLEAAQLSKDPRSRRRRTIHPDQLALVLAGEVETTYGYSFILTNLEGDPLSIETWFRQRTDVEERIREAKLGFGLRHLPSGNLAVNAVWMWASFLALNLSTMTQALGLRARSRAHAKRLRRELLCVPGRVLRHARHIVVRLPLGADHLVAVYERLRLLPSPAG